MATPGWVIGYFGGWRKIIPKKSFLTHKNKGSLAQDTQEMEVWLWDGSDDLCWHVFLGKWFFSPLFLNCLNCQFEPRSFHGWEFTSPMINSCCNENLQCVCVRMFKIKQPLYSDHWELLRKDCTWNPCAKGAKEPVDSIFWNTPPFRISLQRKKPPEQEIPPAIFFFPRLTKNGVEASVYIAEIPCFLPPWSQ